MSSATTATSKAALPRSRNTPGEDRPAAEPLSVPQPTDGPLAGLQESFLHCTEDAATGAITAEPFIDGCAHIGKVLSAFGLAMTIAKDDVQEKTAILRQLTKDPIARQQDISLQALVVREIEHHCGPLSRAAGDSDKPYHEPGADEQQTWLGGAERPWSSKEMAPLFKFAKKHPSQCLTRTLLRLLWALEFTTEILERMSAKPDASLRDCASQAYAATLARRHPWSVRAGVKAGLLTLPSRSVLLARLDCAENPSALYDVPRVLKPIILDLHQFFSDMGLQDIP